MVSTKKWLDILPESGVVGILGKRRQGKTALAYHLAEERHQQNESPAVVLGPPLALKSKFPSWFTIVSELGEFLRYPNHTAIIDEGSLQLHARQSLSRQHTEFDQILSLCGQLGQLFIFCTHHSRKLDPLVVEEYEVLAFKVPGQMHTRMERREIRQWSERARAALLEISEEERKQWAYVLYDDLDQEALLPNPLPSFWCDEISKAVSIAVTQEGLDSLVREQAVPKDSILEVDDIRRALYGASLGVWDSNPELKDKIVHCAETLKPVVCYETEWSLTIKQEALARLEECFVYEDMPGELARLKQRLMTCLTADL